MEMLELAISKHDIHERLYVQNSKVMKLNALESFQQYYPFLTIMMTVTISLLKLETIDFIMVLLFQEYYEQHMRYTIYLLY